MLSIRAHAPLGGGVSGSFDSKGMEDMVKNLHRPFNAHFDAFYAESRDNTFGYQAGKPIVQESIGIGCGRARAQWGICEVETRGPNAEAGVRISSNSIEAFASYEQYDVSASTGPLKVSYSQGANIGGKVGPDGVEGKVMGTGVSVGRKMGASYAGFGLEVELW